MLPILDVVLRTGGAVAPSFNLPLTTTLVPYSARGDGTPTFTRATTAYVADHEGILRQVQSGAARFTGARRVRNILGVSTTDLTGWSKVGTPTISAATVSDPSGGSTATTITATGTNDEVYVQVTGRIAGNLTLNSVWMRRRTGTGAVSLHNGEVYVAVTAVITSAWQRISAPATATASVDSFMAFKLATSGDAIDVWHPQMEDVTGQSVTAPSEFVSVGVLSAPYHGAGVDGVKYFNTTNGNTVASNVVTEATGAAISTSTLLGYLAEGARTNICLQSNEFDEAVWAATDITVDDQSVAAPDGATTADTLTATGANGTIIQDLGVIASAVKVFSVYLKRKTGTGNIDLTLNGGTNWTTVAVTTSWAKYEITATLADPDVGIRIVTSGDEVYAWGAQVEAASFASSAIPTTTAATTRNADSLTFVAANNVSGTSGALVCEVARINVSANSSDPYVGAAAGQPYMLSYYNSTNLRMYDGTNSPVFSAGLTFAAGTTYKLASRWNSSGLVTFCNGAKSATAAGAFDGDIGFGTSFLVGGANFMSNSAWANIRNVKFLNGPLTDAQLVTMTTP